MVRCKSTTLNHLINQMGEGGSQTGTTFSDFINLIKIQTPQLHMPEVDMQRSNFFHHTHSS